jgi:hypothetical protein
MSDWENMAACVVGGLAMGSWDSWSLSLPSMRSRKLACERGSFRGFECHVSALRKIAAAAWAGTRRHYRAFNYYKPHIYIPLSSTTHPRHHYSHHPICSACHGLRFPTSQLHRRHLVCWSLLGACSNGFLCETSIFSQTPLLVCRTTQRYSTSIPLTLLPPRTIVCDS